jgi:hypothetical protein
MSFPELLPPGRLKRPEITLKTSDCVDKDASHQAVDRLDRSRAAPRGVKLCRHDSIAAKKFIA